MTRANDFWLVLQTPSQTILRTRVSQLEAEDAAGRFVVKPSGDPVLTALVPGELALQKSDGSELCLRIGWGTLTKLGQEVRIVADHVDVVGTLPAYQMAG